MKVLILNDVAAPVGGAEIVTYLLRDELRRRGHDARVFASDARGEGPADHHCHGTTSGGRTLNRTANPRAAWTLRRVLKAFRPDVVHVRMFTTQLSPLILPLLRDVPCLHHAGWYGLVCPTGLKLLPDGSPCRRPAGRACRQCLSRRAWVTLMGQRDMIERWRGPAFDVHVAASDTVRDELVARGIDPVVRIWNGVPTRERRPPLRDPPTIAYAGRLSREKGAGLLVEAFGEVARRVPGARLLLLGDGPEREAIERRIAADGTGDRIERTGRVPRERVERLLDAAWVQAIPSRLVEPFGHATAEAMMRGTAVVASDHGGPAELARAAGAGVRVPPGDASALADALVELLADRDRADAIGRAGREWALRHLSLERMVDGFEAQYRRLGAGSAA